jgi:hypothetical protein
MRARERGGRGGGGGGHDMSCLRHACLRHAQRSARYGTVRARVCVDVCVLVDDKVRVPEWLYRSVVWSMAKVWVAYSGGCIALCEGWYR